MNPVVLPRLRGKPVHALIPDIPPELSVGGTILIPLTKVKAISFMEKASPFMNNSAYMLQVDCQLEAVDSEEDALCAL